MLGKLVPEYSPPQYFHLQNIKMMYHSFSQLERILSKMAILKGEIAVFSIIGCPYCIRAKSKLEELGLPYIDINLDRYKEARDFMIQRTSKKTVPQIFFNSKHIGGWSEMRNLVSFLFSKCLSSSVYVFLNQF